MQPVEVFFGFQRCETLRQAWNDPIAALGHVEAFGFTRDDTWFFLDPNRRHIDLRIAHRHDEVEALMTAIMARSWLVLRTEAAGKLRMPPFGPYTCASVCGHLVGLRAFTPRGLARKLRAINAVEVKNEGARRRPEGQARSTA